MKKKKIAALFGLSILILGTFVIILIGWSLNDSQTRKNYSKQIMLGEVLGKENVVLQSTDNECGPCAIKMIFDYYDVPLSLKNIENELSLTDKGTSMLDLKRIAERKGLEAEGWKYTYEYLIHSTFPSILYVNGNHFIVADSIRQDTLYFRNPALGRMKVGKNELCEIWKGETLIFKENKK